MVPPPPARFSISTRVPSCWSSCTASGRANASVPPPAANGTINMIGFCGQDWASAGPAPIQRLARAATIRVHARFCFTFISSLFCFCELRLKVDQTDQPAWTTPSDKIHVIQNTCHRGNLNDLQGECDDQSPAFSLCLLGRSSGHTPQ